SSAVAALAATALLPGFLADRLARHDAAGVSAGDVSGRLAVPPRAIEIDMRASFQGGPDEPLRRAPCDEICQALLLGREVDAVRIRAVDAGGQRVVQSIVYSYAERPACPPAFAEAKTALPVTQAAATRGRCIVAAIDGAWTPGVRLVVREERNGWLSSVPWLHTAGTLTRWEIEALEGPGWRLVARATELRTGVLTVPLVVGYPNSYGLELRPGWERRERVFGATSAAAVLRAATGLRVTMPDPDPPEPARQTIDRILSSGGDAPLGPELMAVINAHLDTLRGALSPEDVALLQRLLASKRIVDHFRIYLALERHPDVAAPVIGDILDKLAIPVDESKGHDHSHLAWIVVRAPIDSVKPYGERVLAVAGMSDQWHLAPLLEIVGRLDADGSDLLARRLNAKSDTVRLAAAVGVCAADQPWAAGLVPTVEALIERNRGKSFRGDEVVVASKTMQRHGHGAAADAFLATLPEQDARRIAVRLSRPPTGNPVRDCTP
ncbi:MAG: hypothetical protein HXX10_28100, partial [Rhodoplanes sp.]|uniref:hypothetical protein n=1 Tax=Rhodoplanes sp. TaxID=1968906 RepID=UPI0018295A5D